MLIIYSALAQLQLAQDLCQVPVVAQVLVEVDMVEVLFPVVDLLVDLALLLATSAAGQTISLVTVCRMARAPLMI
jgi:hypothetical protein